MGDNKLQKNNFLLSRLDQKDAIEDWFSGEGQLSCDVYQTADSIIVKSTIAGVDQKNLDISVSNDILTIRGFREMNEEVADEDFFSRECYWGSFSRSIVLPQEIDSKKVSANLKNGILTIKLPKKYKTTSIKIRQSND
ncbi:MAG: Hsp20/alpha crystallin family protein [Desulfobacula sp.]|jgi:HSP20 family protein